MATQMQSGSQAQTGTKDETYNLVSVLYHSLQGAETIETYKQDVGGDQQLSQFFEQAQQQYRQLADQAKQMLGSKLQGGQQGGGGSAMFGGSGQQS